MKHTPGPWRNDYWKATPTFHVPNPMRVSVVADARGEVIAQLEGAATKIQHANARLIAAAPELLEACKVVLAYLDNLESKPEPDFDPELSLLRRQFHAPLRAKLEPAIKKAEGAE